MCFHQLLKNAKLKKLSMTLDHVPFQSRTLSSGVSANAALIGLLASVQANVVHHVRRPRRLVLAKSAEVQGDFGQRRASLPNADNALTPQLDSLPKREGTIQ
jgi:hypothetical protein